MKKTAKRKVLPIAIITALSGLFAIGAVNTQNYKETRAESQNYTLQITPTNLQTNSYRDSQTNLKIAEQQYAKLSNSNTSINVQGNYYGNQHGIYTNTQKTINIYNSNYTLDQTDLQSLYAIAITPYNNNINTNIQTSINIQMDIYNQIEDYIYLNVKIYRSLDAYFQNFINKENWSVDGAIYNWLQDLTNPELMLEYTTETYRTRITDDGHYYGTKSLNYDITITPSNTNYYLIYIYPETTINDEDARQIDGKGIFITESNILNISGTNLIPTGQYEIVDVGGLFFQILTTPFSFFSQAFNLTLFPNTPYAINISNLILGILAVIIFVFIIKLIIGAMSKMG